MITTIALLGFLVAGVCALVRMLRGPTVADRVIALDVALLAVMGGVAVDAAATRSSENLELLVVAAVVGFTATVFASRYVQYEEVEP